MSLRALSSTAAAFVVVALLAVSSGTARAATVVETSTVENGYPRTLTFKVTAKSDADITDVTLNYSIKGRGTSALAKPDSITPGKNLSVDVALDVNSSSNYIPVGSEFTYRWEIRTSDGNTFTSPDQTFFYMPPNRDWKNVANDFMTVYYHGERQQIAEAYLRAGTDTYEKIGKTLYGIELSLLPVKVIIFADEAESDPARPGSGGRFDAAVTTCGTKVTNDILLVIPVACGSSDRTDTLRHELGHILNETAGEGTLAKMPAWLDEGAAVYAQTSPGDYARAFQTAVQQNRLIGFQQMTQPASNPNQVQLFYGQAWAMVSYLIEEKGTPEQFAQFMRTIKGGQRYDQALNTVYGYADVAAFESDFKGALGLAPGQQQPTAQPTARPTQQQQATPTRTPTRTPAPANTGDGDDDSGIGTGTIVIGGVALLFLFGAVLAFLASMMMANNRKAAAARAASQTPAWRPPDSNDPPA